MSIHEQINARCAEGVLFRVEPFMTGMVERRTIYAASEVYQLIEGPWQRAEDEERWESARAFLDQFLSGGVITVPKQRWHKHAYMARLEKAHEEVWEFRIRAPKPGIRLFGRFAAKDVFVALEWNDRPSLLGPTTREGKAAWTAAKRECKHMWRRFFPSYAPLSNRAYPHEYISNADPR